MVARIARARGPWSASVAKRSETSSMVTSIPTAFMWSQRQEESALVSRKAFSSSRLSVPSSTTFPAASHQGV